MDYYNNSNKKDSKIKDTERKIENMREIISDKDKVREIAQKLVYYIKEK